jgi:hypothetical protein
MICSHFGKDIGTGTLLITPLYIAATIGQPLMGRLNAEQLFYVSSSLILPQKNSYVRKNQIISYFSEYNYQFYLFPAITTHLHFL